MSKERPLWVTVEDKPGTGSYQLELKIGEDEVQIAKVLAVDAPTTSELPFRAQDQYLKSLKQDVVVAVRCKKEGLCRIRVHPEAQIKRMQRKSSTMDRHRGHFLTEETIPPEKQKNDQYLSPSQIAGLTTCLKIEGIINKIPFLATVRFVPSKKDHQPSQQTRLPSPS